MEELEHEVEGLEDLQETLRALHNEASEKHDDALEVTTYQALLTAPRDASLILTISVLPGGAQKSRK